MRVTFFGSGSPMSAMALREVAARHEVPLVVIPVFRLGRRARIKRLFGLLPPTPLEAEARRLDVPIARYHVDRIDALRKAIRDARPDLIAVASFPVVLPAALLEVPGVNIHHSLLPRHRGSDPLFWSFHADDRDTGTTVHWLAAEADAGDIVSQRVVPIERGMTAMQLYERLSQVGAVHLAEALDAINRGTSGRTPQDPAEAFRDPSPLKGTWRVESDHWPAERTWHFLRGIGDMYGRLCRDAAGQPLAMGAACEYQVVEHREAAGTHVETPGGLRLYCRDGIVDVTRPTPRPSGRR